MLDRFVILLSRSPAIPTFYARSGSTFYAASIENDALHFSEREVAEGINLERRLDGVVEPCRCPRPPRVFLG